MSFDIDRFPKLKEVLNAILNNGGIAELKIEKNKTPVCVEIKRTLKGSGNEKKQ